jgi:ribosomal protein S27AE
MVGAAALVGQARRAGRAVRWAGARSGRRAAFRSTVAMLVQLVHCSTRSLAAESAPGRRKEQQDKDCDVCRSGELARARSARRVPRCSAGAVVSRADDEAPRPTCGSCGYVREPDADTSRLTWCIVRQDVRSGSSACHSGSPPSASAAKCCGRSTRFTSIIWNGSSPAPSATETSLRFAVRAGIGRRFTPRSPPARAWIRARSR